MLGLHCEALGTTFAEVPTLYPEALQSQIDETSDWIYHAINNGAYKVEHYNALSSMSQIANILCRLDSRDRKIPTRRRIATTLQL
jgi:glutathionyl-hydroquinone reductase